MIPGFYDIPIEDYQSQSGAERPRLTQTIAKLIAGQSPIHGWHAHPKLGGGCKATTKEMDFGSVAHKLLLGKGSEISVGDYENYKTNAAKDFRDDARKAKRLPILRQDFVKANAMADIVRSRLMLSEASDFFDDGFESEVAAIFQAEAADGCMVECQSLIDRLNRSTGKIYDLKFTTSAEENACQRKIASMGYDVQVGMNTLAVETLIPALAGRVEFVFIFVESEMPHALSLHRLSGEWQAIGRSRVERAINAFSECLATGIWPGYSRNIITLDPPPWALNAEIMAG